MVWKIQATTEGFDGHEINIDHDMVIGRNQDADVVLQAAEISRKHAVLLVKDTQLWVQDLNSSNGTWVNGARITEDTQLHEGDLIQFGNFQFRVEIFVEPKANAVHDPIPINKDAVEFDYIAKPMPSVPSDEGMPTLSERAAETSINREGMPENMSAPKPAPIPSHVEVKTVVDPEPIVIAQPVAQVTQEKEQQKNASVGLITVVVLIILAILAWLFFK